MSKVLIIGCGGVASVAIHKCCQVPEVFTEICIASRTKSKCDKLAAELAPKTATKITTAQVDADKVDEVIALIKAYQPDLVMNIALPYQDLTIMDACLACGVNYMDTANYEPENTDDPEWRAIYEKRCKEAGFSAYFDYSWQWAYAKKFEEAGLTALLGSGFDPGVTQAYCAYAKKHEHPTKKTREHMLAGLFLLWGCPLGLEPIFRNVYRSNDNLPLHFINISKQTKAAAQNTVPCSTLRPFRISQIPSCFRILATSSLE